MKNREKYKNELMEAIKGSRLCAFMHKYGVYRMFNPDWESFCAVVDCHFCPTALQIWLDEEYKEPEVDWDNVPVDTLVMVWDSDSDYTYRYFKGKKGTKYEVWESGATSKTADDMTESWEYCELVEEEYDGCN